MSALGAALPEFARAWGAHPRYTLLIESDDADALRSQVKELVRVWFAECAVRGSPPPTKRFDEPRALFLVAMLAAPFEALEVRADDELARWLGLAAGPLAAGTVSLTVHGGNPQRVVRQTRVHAHGAILSSLPARDPAYVDWIARKVDQADGLVWISGEPADVMPAGARERLARRGFVCANPVASGAGSSLWRRGYGAQVVAATPVQRRALVLGAGLAGAALSSSLAQRSWSVDVLEAGEQIAAGASGNAVAAFRAHLSLDRCVLSRLSAFGVRALLQSLRRDDAFARGLAGQTGLIQVAQDAADYERLQALARAWRQAQGQGQAQAQGQGQGQGQRQGRGKSIVDGIPEVRAVDQDEASRLAGIELLQGGLWLAEAGWARPAALCQHWLTESSRGLGSIRVRLGASVGGLIRDGDDWVALDAWGSELARAPVLVLANGGVSGGVNVGACGVANEGVCGGVSPQASGVSASALAAQVGGALAAFLPVPGSIGLFHPAQLPSSACVLAGAGYLMPPVAGITVAGARYDAQDIETSDLASVLRVLSPSQRPQFGQRRAVRWGMRDHLPVAGAVPAQGAFHGDRVPGLYVLGAFGSRGLVWSVLLGQAVAALINREPDLLPSDLMVAVDPIRFQLRDQHLRTISPVTNR